jgi:hypothetical protein
MRLTEDGHMVCEMDSVFEIQYRRLNEETSIPEPTLIRASETDRKIWKFYPACSFACRQLMEKEQWPDLKEIEIIPTIKLVADDSKRSKANY